VRDFNRPTVYMVLIVLLTPQFQKDVRKAVCNKTKRKTKNEVAGWRVHGPEEDGFNPLKPELNPICYLLALLGAHHFLYVSRIRVKLLTFRLLISCIYGAPILDVSRSHTTTQHSR